MILGLMLACAPPDYSAPPVITTEVEDWRDEVLYQVIVDRFADGDRNNNWNVTQDPAELGRTMGGDWQGLIDRVDYLKQLGVTAIWISPVVQNVETDAGMGSYHGYWTQSFVDTNPHMGDLARLRELTDVMHQNGIAVVVDIVVNHVGQLFYYDINRNGQPDINAYYATDGSDTVDLVTEWDPAFDARGIQSFTSLGESGPAPVEWVYMPEIGRVPPQPEEFQNEDWYHKMGRVTDWSNAEQVELGDFPGGLKDLATEDPNVRRALIDIFSEWIVQTNIDGYRIDTVKHVERDFWAEFAPALRAHADDIGKDNFFLFGEVFDGDDALIGSYSGAEGLDSLVWFSQKYQVYDGVFKQGGATRAIPRLYDDRASHYSADPVGPAGQSAQSLLVNFMDNHDVARFLYDAPDPASIHAALVFLYTQDGVPCLYYGTEQGFSGGNDPANREPLWPSGYATEGPLFQRIAALSALRAELAPLRRGDLRFVWSTDHTGDEDDAGILAFERSYEGETALVVVNSQTDQTSWTGVDGAAMAVSFPPGTVLQQRFPTARTVVVGADGTLLLDVPPAEGLILVAAP